MTASWPCKAATRADLDERSMRWVTTDGGNCAVDSILLIVDTSNDAAMRALTITGPMLPEACLEC